MKTKNNLMAALAAGLFMTCVTFTSCTSDIGDNPVYNDEPNGGMIVGEIVVTNGMLILNNGSSDEGFDGSLTYVDFNQNPYDVKQGVYKNVNGESLGGTPNDVLAYGKKIYIAGSDEHAVFVLDARNYKLIKKISTTGEMGDAEGINPRHLLAYGDKVYVSTYGGYVGVIDTLSLSIYNQYKVGPYPEGMAISETAAGVSLYVANSDYGMGNGSISKINLTSGFISEFTNDKIHYPQQLAVVGDGIYVLDWGYYDDTWIQHDAGVYLINGSSVRKIIPDATGMAVAGYSIITYNCPYGSTSLSYSIYNIAYGHLDSFHLTGDDINPIYNPCAISMDPNTGYVYIASRQKDSDTNYPSYSTPGYVNAYSGNGHFISSFSTGIEPCASAFIYGISKL